MMKYLLISGLFAFFASCSSTAPAASRPPSASQSTAEVWSDNMRSENSTNRYSVVLKTPKISITGVCLLKKKGDEWHGTFMNEFGAKIFDFIVFNKKCKLLNVTPKMNKWYIRNVVAADLYFLFSIDRTDVSFAKKSERFEQDGRLVVDLGKKQITTDVSRKIVKLTNSRRNLQYELTKID